MDGVCVFVCVCVCVCVSVCVCVCVCVCVSVCVEWCVTVQARSAVHSSMYSGLHFVSNTHRVTETHQPYLIKGRGFSFSAGRSNGDNRQPHLAEEALN